MANKASFLLLIALFLAFSTSSIAINITRILDQYPDTYGSFNALLTASKLNQAINKRETVTILALDNDSIDTLSGRPIEEVRKILSNHVILDYFDVIKLKSLKTKKSITITTLYQTTGVAEYSQGFLNVSMLGSGEIVFGSAMKGSPLNAKLLGSVMNRPYNISVLHISEPIIAMGFVNGPLAAPPPSTNGTNSTAKHAPAPPPMESDEPTADAPVEGPTDAPAAEGPEASTPADAPAPAADAPKGDEADAPKAADDDTPEDSSETPASGGSMNVVGSRIGGMVIMGFAVNLLGF
ncbi:hypothetical protein ACFE04_001736 [Oxalis oulophora]